MFQALIAVCCAAAVHPPLAQDWSDTSLIRADDDWSDVPAIVGYRGDGLVAAPGTDPRDVVADGSGTPVDVAANRTDPDAIGLAAGVTEFELSDPVVALRGSATAGAPQLVLSLDTSGRTGIDVRLTLRDLDDAADAIQPVAVQYRVGDAGKFANVAGGYVADATASSQTDLVGSARAERRTPVRVDLPGTADDHPLVQVRVLTTDAIGRDEWVGVDDIEVTAATVTPPGCDAAPPSPNPSSPTPDTDGPNALHLSGLTLMPNSFAAAARGPAIPRRGRSGTSLAFWLSGPATARFRVTPGGERLRFQVRGRRGVNRVRFSGRIRGRSLAAGSYTLTGTAVNRTGLRSAPQAVPFRIERPQD